ncbi:MAG: hypothetical protein K2K31_01770 [Clostridia bacterium]|nr:hypothetical protein [Clostridia bacterium]
MKKLKGALLCLLLCCCMIVPIFAFTGCGGIDPETVTKSLNDLTSLFTDNKTVFIEGYIDPDVDGEIKEGTGIKTKYKVNYGENLSKAIKDELEHDMPTYGYQELDRKYNVIFAYANEFIDTYKVYLPKKEDKLSDDTNKALETLNEGIKEYSESVLEFIKQKNITDNYYNTTDFSITTGLRSFERSYGAMIEKAVNVSSALADVLEYNNIINYIKEFSSTSDRTMIVEGFVRAKLLPVYSNFMLSEIKNKIWWETTSDEDGVTKGEITSLIKRIENSFNSFKGYVKKATTTETKTDKDIFEAVNLKHFF